MLSTCTLLYMPDLFKNEALQNYDLVVPIMISFLVSESACLVELKKGGI